MGCFVRNRKSPTPPPPPFPPPVARTAGLYLDWDYTILLISHYLPMYVCMYVLKLRYRDLSWTGGGSWLDGDALVPCRWYHDVLGRATVHVESSSSVCLFEKEGKKKRGGGGEA